MLVKHPENMRNFAAFVSLSSHTQTLSVEHVLASAGDAVGQCNNVPASLEFTPIPSSSGCLAD
jgi:hypothetical protein